MENKKQKLFSADDNQPNNPAIIIIPRANITIENIQADK